MSQELRYAVSFIVFRDSIKKEFLVVKRPEDDKELGGIWGLPAIIYDPTKISLDEAVKIGGLEKLACLIEPIRKLLTTIIQKRKDYDLLMADYECRIVEGEPDVNKAQSKHGTKYVDQMWTSDPTILYKGAERGSACIQLFLHDLGLWPNERFITELI